MSQILSIKEYEPLQITKFKQAKDFESLKKKYVAFTGSPRSHPYDAFKMVLISDPYSGSNQYFEFQMDDIAYVEELPHMGTIDEEVIPIVRIWIRKNSIGIRCIPFFVADLA
jgi:inorganic pyrophosphatase